MQRNNVNYFIDAITESYSLKVIDVVKHQHQADSRLSYILAPKIGKAIAAHKPTNMHIKTARRHY